MTPNVFMSNKSIDDVVNEINIELKLLLLFNISFNLSYCIVTWVSTDHTRLTACRSELFEFNACNTHYTF